MVPVLWCLSTIPKHRQPHNTNRSPTSVNSGNTLRACHACPRPHGAHLGRQELARCTHRRLPQGGPAESRPDPATAGRRSLHQGLRECARERFDQAVDGRPRLPGGRLGTTASRLMADEEPAWNRLDVDLKLASGDWQGALDGYAELVRRPPTPSSGLSCCAARPKPWPASTAAQRLSQRPARPWRSSSAPDANLMRPWPATGWAPASTSRTTRPIHGPSTKHSLAGTVGPARRARLRLRLLMALSAVEGRDGNHSAALATSRKCAAWRRSSRPASRDLPVQPGVQLPRDRDYEGALRAGYSSLGLQGAAARVELASLENDLALAHLRLAT